MKRNLVSAFFAIFILPSMSFAEGANSVTRCHGNEPFWGLEISKETIKLTHLDDVTMTISNVGAKAADGVSADYISLYQGRTKENNNKFMNVIIKASECSDHMSDDLYPYSVFVLSGNKLLEGCCSGK